MGLLDAILGGNTLFFKGCTINFAAKEIGENYRRILDRCGVDYIEIEKENCCGSILLNTSRDEDFRKLTAENIKKFKEVGVKRIICPCPTCAHVFSTYYKDFEVKYVLEIVWENISKFSDMKGKFLGKVAYFHEPCHLSRGLGITSIPFKILEFLGFKILEDNMRGRFSMCCGAGGGLRARYKEIAERIGRTKVEYLLKKFGNLELIVTSCPMCYIHLKKVCESLELNIDVKEISELIV